MVNKLVFREGVTLVQIITADVVVMQHLTRKERHDDSKTTTVRKVCCSRRENASKLTAISWKSTRVLSVQG